MSNDVCMSNAFCVCRMARQAKREEMREARHRSLTDKHSKVRIAVLACHKQCIIWQPFALVYVYGLLCVVLCILYVGSSEKEVVEWVVVGCAQRRRRQLRNRPIVPARQCPAQGSALV